MPASPLRLGAADSTTPVGASLLAIFVKKLASKLAPTGVVLSAAPRLRGEAGMTDDLIWNKRAVLLASSFYKMMYLNTT